MSNNLVYDRHVIESKLLWGEDITIEGVGTLYSKKLKDIRELNKHNPHTYDEYISILSITSYKIYEMLGMDDRFENIPPFEFIVRNALSNDKFKQKVIDALGFFFNAKAMISMTGMIYLNNKDLSVGVLHEGNFDFVIDIFRIQNCINSNETKNKKPISEAQKQFYLKLAEQRAKHESKHNVLDDIVSSVAAKHPSVNFLNIGDLTMYQLIDHYKRLNAIDDFYISIKSLLAGASKDEVKVKHWSQRIIDT